LKEGTRWRRRILSLFYEIEEREVVALYSGLKPEIVAFDPP